MKQLLRTMVRGAPWLLLHVRELTCSKLKCSWCSNLLGWLNRRSFALDTLKACGRPAVLQRHMPGELRVDIPSWGVATVYCIQWKAFDL